jgi:hypothetical protein
MIEFERHPVKLEHMNTRVEQHGDQEAPMLDLKFSADLPNTKLNELSETLRAALFAAEEQPDMLGPNAEHMPVLKNPQLGTLHWAADLKPVMLTLHLGARARDDLVLGGGKLGKVTLRPVNGGSFAFGFRLQVEPGNNMASKLITLLRHEVPGTLNCSEAAMTNGADDDDEGGGEP